MKKILVIMDKEHTSFLTRFDMRGDSVLAFNAAFQKDWEHALKNDYEKALNDEEHMNDMKKWTELVDGELVVIEVESNIKSLAGEVIEQQEETKTKEMETLDYFRKLFE